MCACVSVRRLGVILRSEQAVGGFIKRSASFLGKGRAFPLLPPTIGLTQPGKGKKQKSPDSLSLSSCQPHVGVRSRPFKKSPP